MQWLWQHQFKALFSIDAFAVAAVFVLAVSRYGTTTAQALVRQHDPLADTPGHLIAPGYWWNVHLCLTMRRLGHVFGYSIRMHWDCFNDWTGHLLACRGFVNQVIVADCSKLFIGTECYRIWIQFVEFSRNGLIHSRSRVVVSLLASISCGISPGKWIASHLITVRHGEVVNKSDSQRWSVAQS